SRALESLEGFDARDVKDPRFFTYRASLLLATGSVDAARRDLEQALKLAPNDGDALAQRAIMAVAANQADLAVDTAKQAVAAAPKSASAHVAQSYARQAKFDLPGARESLETAVAVAPNGALAWARLAEIRSSLGYRAEALEAAQKAVALDPNLSRTQSVLGYSYLTQVKTREAREAFAKAIALDGGDPLPRLGLGLAQIREGHLAEGTKEIEVAASLDPEQALVRSYLGKAYFEAKRDPLDQREFDVAKTADPKDPTPLLYEAIAKQTRNEPVAALKDIQQAIELNDNRGVYRSRLLLDQDLAARSASLGRIYSDLGFQDLALVEGWSSVNTDPGNYSAHRLLADSYAALPRHEIARVSELFQSQMLQPLNTTPIQPRLGESNLFLISSQGPSALAFNEFNPLFNRNQVNAQGTFLAGEDSTLTGEGIVSGIFDKFSFSAGYSGFKTDGFRENATQDDKIANAFAQLALSPSTSLQAEVRHRKVESGDIDLRFNADDFSTLQAQTVDGTNYRVGLRHDFGPAVTVLGSYMHSDKDIDFSLPDPLAGVDFGITRNEKADSAEGQMLFRSGRVKAVAGAGYFDIRSAETNTLDLTFEGFSAITDSDTKIKHTNLYAYSYISILPNLTATLGLSGDLFDENGTALASTVIADFPPDPATPTDPAVLGEKNQANPKIGLNFTARTGTTLRGAWFKTLKRTLVTDQTLEPTQVAGFNQFFDDPSATQSKVWGAAIDQKFGKSVFGGVEYTRRELVIPQTFPAELGGFEIVERAGDEHLARAYLFAAPHRFLTFGAEYQYEKFDVDPDAFLAFSTVKTHRVPLSARFFHPSGWGAFLGATYLKQDGEFRTSTGSEFLPGQTDFWVVDAALRYRLPRRYG
ncbi:MAG TPA: tetratricopeptide repeat protein, partial [Vicinamibacteria bacterium]|nr:tetratricopeptide repeat protein [Vicinamibacteria bacterium]